MSAEVAIVLLAAGRSRRFPGNKLLAKIDGELIIEKVVGTCLRSSVDRLVVVTGHEADTISQILRKFSDPRLKVVHNDRFDEGQSSSVKVGVGAVAGEVDAVIIHPADVALIEPEDIERLIDAYRSTGSPIVVATHMGRHGHPILFSKEIIPEILEISEERFGLKEVVERHRREILEVECSKFTVIDIDTPEDLARVLAEIKGPDQA